MRICAFRAGVSLFFAPESSEARSRKRSVMTQVWLWVGFSCLILGMLAIDLGVLNRHSHVVSVKEAARWSAVVVTTALLFNGWIFYARGTEAGLQFTAGYLIELALSVDN